MSAESPKISSHCIPVFTISSLSSTFSQCIDTISFDSKFTYIS